MSNPRIAVIAIHGVGDHKPFEIAKSVAGMLEDLKDGPQQPRYGTFTESIILMNVSPVKVEGRAFSPAASTKVGTPIPEQGSWGPMGALYENKHDIQHSIDSKPKSLDHLFLEGQLAHYKGEGPEDTNEVLRLEGRRRANAAVGLEQESNPNVAGSAPRPSNLPEEEVHVYDMFWSDLSGVSTAGLRIFGELYQLLFHLGSVGVNNVKAAGIFFSETKADAAWRRFDFFQVRAASMLAWPIPLLNLIILALAIGLFADSALVKLSGIQETILTTVVLFACILGVWGYRLITKGQFSTASFWAPPTAFIVLSALAAILAASLADKISRNQWFREVVECTATLLVWIALAAALWAIVCAYEKHRPGTRIAFRRTVTAVVLGCILSFHWWRSLYPTNFVAMVISLHVIEVAFWILLFCWFLFGILFVLAFFAGFFAVKASAAAMPRELDRAGRTNWTARLTLALPAVLFLLLTVAAWTGVVKVLSGVVPHDASFQCQDCSASLRDSGPCKVSALYYTSFRGKPVPVSHWADDILSKGGLLYLPVLLLLICVCGVISIWGLLPSVLDEISPPRGGGETTQKQSNALGNWLNNGFEFMRWGGRLLYLGMFLFPVAMIVAIFPPSPNSTIELINVFARSIEWIKPFAPSMVQTLGTLVAGAAVGLLGLGGQFSKLALGFRPIVRVALDVDNWLREHPRDSNPTARICGRYVSLLRYIAQWQGEDKRGYDALIVFAHSQGAVITYDLLRFLNVEAKEAKSYAGYDSTLAGLDKMPLYVFTMGCPLRQLYGLRFPYLYGYAPTGPEEANLPDPADLGLNLVEWVNTYRTGDYVGRYLWRDNPWDPVDTISYSTWDPPQGIPKNIWIDAKRKRIEFTIGPGAHTHYWDSTAKPIAEMLDVLIARSRTGQPV